MTKMYSPSPPTLSHSLDYPSVGLSGSTNSSVNHHPPHHNHYHHHHNHPPTHPPHHHHHQEQQNSQCLRFKYFTTFIICTTCLALLSASLATHKWIISKPIRILKLNGGQTNLTSLMLTAQSDQFYDQRNSYHHHHHHPHTMNLPLTSNGGASGGGGGSSTSPDLLNNNHQLYSSQNNKFQGEIYFGLFKGVKVLNYGFGDRLSPISVFQAQFAKDNTNNNQQQQQHHQHQELLDFKLWLLTLLSVVVAIIFALIGSIFAIINFVMTLRGTLTGPVGLVIWNATACFACLLAMVSWLIEYFARLQANVLTVEEVQNGWTSENRSQFGYSYYLVVLAFVLHLVNIFIISIVQFGSWTNNKAAKRQSRSVCEGVIMLY